jgi:hypothetical protein
MTTEIKELLIKTYTSSLEEARRQYWEYYALPLDKRYKLMQQYIDNLKNNE